MAAQRYILNHESLGEPLILEFAPDGWDDLKYTISRSGSFHGLFRTYSGPLRFVKDGKIFIDGIVTTYGTEAEISIVIQELNQSTKIWETKVSGILNFDPETYSKSEIHTELNFEDSVVHKKFRNRENLEIAYNRKESINGTILPGFASESETVVLRGQEGRDEGDATGIYPFEAFNRIFQVICDLDYNPVISSVLGRPLYGYASDGLAANVMLSKGLLMRGATLAGDEVREGETNLNFKARELFENFDKLFNLGLDIQFDSVNDRYNFVIEEKGFFYQTTELFTLDNISDLTYEYESELMIQKIKSGYRKFAETNDFGLSEYNNSIEFSAPISISDTELNIESTYRADGTAFQIAIENRFTVSDEENKTDIDEDIFFIHVFDDSGTLKSVKNEGFDLIGGLYGPRPIQANIFISPARNMTRWGEFIRASLSFFTEDGVIRFNKAENLSDLRSQTTIETETLFENRDLDISSLRTPRFSGRKANFNNPLTRAQIDIIDGNPYGIVKFWDYFDKVWNYGWIKEASTDRVDRDTTWELWEVANLEEIANNLIYMDEDDILLMDGSTAIKTLA
jgi:hypothetical protein